MPISNKQRGKYFENKITLDYQKLFKLDKTECYRAGSSGARTSIEYNGDISFSNPEKYPLITECKYYSKMTLDDFFPVCKSYIDKWLKQVYIEKDHYIKKYNKEPFVVIIAGRPYLNDHYVIILQENFKYLKDIRAILKFYSESQKKQYNLISYSDLLKILAQKNFFKFK